MTKTDPIRFEIDGYEFYLHAGINVYHNIEMRDGHSKIMEVLDARGSPFCVTEEEAEEREKRSYDNAFMDAIQRMEMICDGMIFETEAEAEAVHEFVERVRDRIG